MDHTFRERRLHPVLLIRGGLALPQPLKIVSSARHVSTEGNYSKVLTRHSTTNLFFLFLLLPRSYRSWIDPDAKTFTTKKKKGEGIDLSKAEVIAGRMISQSQVLFTPAFVQLKYGSNRCIFSSRLISTRQFPSFYLQKSPVLVCVDFFPSKKKMDSLRTTSLCANIPRDRIEERCRVGKKQTSTGWLNPSTVALTIDNFITSKHLAVCSESQGVERCEISRNSTESSAGTAPAVYFFFFDGSAEISADYNQ